MQCTASTKCASITLIVRHRQRKWSQKGSSKVLQFVIIMKSWSHVVTALSLYNLRFCTAQLQEPRNISRILISSEHLSVSKVNIENSSTSILVLQHFHNCLMHGCSSGGTAPIDEKVSCSIPPVCISNYPIGKVLNLVLHSSACYNECDKSTRDRKKCLYKHVNESVLSAQIK